MDERGRLSLRIDEARDRETLSQLRDEARAHCNPRVQALQFKAAQRLAQMRVVAPPPSSQAGATPPRPALSFAAPYGVSAPQDAALYRYHVTDEAYARLQKDLARFGSYEALETGYRPALFVLWASDWFRRSYRGGGHRWVELTNELGLREDQGRLRALAAKGLKQWRRPVLKASAGYEFLATLAREGGFPVAAVEQGGRGWARDMLAAIVAPLLADPGAGHEQAEALARARRHRLPKSFQDDEFVLLCADLAMAVVAIRRESDAIARAAGLPLAVWLEHHRPGWQDELPLTVNGAGAEALLGELFAVEAAAVGGAGVRAERLLVRDDDGGWQEAVRIMLDGPVDGQVMRGIDSAAGRLRVFAAGDLARVLPGELAMLDPPGEGESAWTARSTKRTRGLLPVAFTTSIECDLRSGEQRIARVMLPGGKPRRGQLLICTIAQGDADKPRALKIEGSGSGLFVADTVVVQVPFDWRVEGREGEEVVAIGAGVGDARLWRIDGGAIITDDSGDCYQIRTGQSRDRRDRIQIDDHLVRWATVEGDVDLFAGPPTLRPSDRTRGSLYFRPIGARGAWQPAPSPLPVGHYEIGWRDGSLLLDRRRLAVVPPGAAIACSGRGREARWELTGWQSAKLTPAVDAPVRVDGDRWRARPVAHATYWFAAHIDWADGPPLEVKIAFPTEASIARWDGTLLDANAQLTLADLSDLVAVNPGRMEMFGELVEQGGRGDPAVMRWEFCDELPMSSAAEDIASMLLPASNDAKVRLGMLDGVETYWEVRPFAIRLTRLGGQLMAMQGVAAPDVEVCGRAFVDPATEVSFGTYSLLSCANHRPFGLPLGSKGDWMTYLRDSEAVLSRPEILSGEMPAAVQSTPLARAMALPPWEGLTAALHVVLDEAGQESSAGARTTETLIAIVCSLRGLPPSSFEVLRLLPHHPDVLARMVLRAEPEQRDTLLALSDALPFAWCTIPKKCWDAAGEHQFALLLEALGEIEGAGHYAMQSMAEAIAQITQREPLLEPVLKGPVGAPKRMDVAMTFARRVIDGRATGRASGSRYRERGLSLPADHLRLPEQVLELLDTPCAAALAVTGTWTPQPDDIRHIKTVARNFPTFFADAFAASLTELS